MSKVCTDSLERTLLCGHGDALQAQVINEIVASRGEDAVWQILDQAHTTFSCTCTCTFVLQHRAGTPITHSENDLFKKRGSNQEHKKHESRADEDKIRRRGERERTTKNETLTQMK